MRDQITHRLYLLVRRHRLRCHSPNTSSDSIESPNGDKSSERLRLDDEGLIGLQSSPHSVLSDSSIGHIDNRFVVATSGPKHEDWVGSMQRSNWPSVKSTGLVWRTSHPIITTSSKRTNPRFNNLWVRLETVPKEE